MGGASRSGSRSSGRGAATGNAWDPRVSADRAAAAGHAQDCGHHHSIGCRGISSTCWLHPQTGLFFIIDFFSQK